MSAVVTSLKLPRALKARIARLAKRAGESPHAFMMRLLTEQVQALEKLDQFLAEAREVDQRMQASGLGYVDEDVHVYLEAKVAGRQAVRPRPTKWRK